MSAAADITSECHDFSAANYLTTFACVGVARRSQPWKVQGEAGRRGVSVSWERRRAVMALRVSVTVLCVRKRRQRLANCWPANAICGIFWHPTTVSVLLEVRKGRLFFFFFFQTQLMQKSEQICSSAWILRWGIDFLSVWFIQNFSCFQSFNYGSSSQLHMSCWRLLEQKSIECK